MKPGFLGIGAQKCASTWLYDILADHPDVSLSEQKELDFFSLYFDRGYQWYERHFDPEAQGKLFGEVSPSYFHVRDVPQRVYDYNPDIRLILFLREPVQRAMSNHKHEVRIGHVSGPDLSFEFGLSNNPLYVEQGRYGTHLAHWLEVFPREQLLIVLFDEVADDGAAVARRVYEFLHIDAGHQPAALNERSNESYVNRSAGLESSKNTVRSVIRKLRLGWLWQGIGSLGLRDAYRSLNRKPSSAVIPPMRPETRQKLQQLFAEELTRLEQLSGLRLDAWRATEGGRS